jgi:hypothetical protein
MSVCPDETTWLLLGGFSWNLVLDRPSGKYVDKIQVSLKSEKNSMPFA